MKTILSIILLAFFLEAQAPSKEFIKEQLIVFTNETNPILAPSDKEMLETLAAEEELNLVFKSVKDGVPAEVTYTPSIYYQNHNGRSFYYGRYKNKSRIKNFIRTSRMVQQGESENIKDEIALWQTGRAQITAPLKITELAGEVPSSFNQDEFINSGKKATLAGMKDFRLEKGFNQSRSTRAFYFNLYPYKSGKSLFISAEIYSQYNCVENVCEKMSVPLVEGKWNDRDLLFAQAGKLIEAEIKRQISQSAIGDAFRPISSQTPNKTWEAIALPLPQKPIPSTAFVNKKVEIPRKWKVEPFSDPSQPQLIFSFLAPLDNYIGEVKKLSGELTLNENGSLQNAKGKFEVNIADLTMGEESFDNEVQNKMLKMDNYPSANFIFESISGGVEPLEIGKVTEIEVKGRFEMMGKKIPLSVPAKIEPVVNDQGEVRLLVSTAYQLSLLESYGLEGPDGPSPASDMLQFYMKFNLESFN